MPSPPTLADAAVPPGLAALRQELDGIDDALHALLMRRAAVVEQVGTTKHAVALRPGREAAILRRLLASHAGRFPAGSMVRLWREMFAGTTAMQAPFSLAVCDTDPAGAFAAAAREQFGMLTPLRSYRTPAQAIGEVSAGSAAAAILPMPAEGEPPGLAWWTALLHRDDPRIHVCARLPFWAARPEGAPKVHALVVSAVPPDPSGEDRSLLGLELPLDASRARLSQILATAGLEAEHTILRRDAGAPTASALVDVAGFVADGDPRLSTLPAVLRAPIVLGAYAAPYGVHRP